MAEMVLDVGVNQASVTKVGESEKLLAAGKSLKIETSPGGADILDYECPAGKSASIRVQVFIVETDA